MNRETKSLGGVLICVAALSCPLHGCAATSSPPSQSYSALLRQYDERFGPLGWGAWRGVWPTTSQDAPFLLSWCRAGYSEYDIRQSRGSLQNRSAFVARLTWPDTDQAPKYFSGDSDGVSIHLWEVPLPKLDEAMGPQDAVQTISEFVQERNAQLSEQSHHWQVCRMEVEQTGQTLDLNFLMLDRSAATPGDVIVLQSIPDALLMPDAWIGSCHSQDKSNTNDAFMRTALFTNTVAAIQHREWQHFGFFSTSNRDRRLEGEVPASSRWRSREQFVRFMQDAEDLGVESFGDPLDPRVQELLKQYLGQVISSAQLQSDADEIFGSWKGLVEATCRFSETFHLPVFAVRHGESAILLSIQWYSSPSELPPHLHAVRVQRIPDIDREVFHNQLTFLRFHPDRPEPIKYSGETISSWFRLGTTSEQ